MLRTERWKIGMQQQFPGCSGHQIDNADMNVCKNLVGIDTRFAGTRHQLADCFAEIGHVIVVHPATS
jgi:hypothetical protein